MQETSFLQKDKEVMLHLDPKGNHNSPSSTIAKSGWGVVVWRHEDGINSSKIRARKIHPSGEPEGRDVILPIGGEVYAQDPKVIFHNAGFTCCWQELAPGFPDPLLRFGHYALDFTLVDGKPPVKVTDSNIIYSGSHCLARNEAGTLGIAFVGHDPASNTMDNVGIYFRGYDNNNNPCNDFVKISDKDGYGENSIVGTDHNNFFIVYECGSYVRSIIYLTKINGFGQTLLDKTLITELVNNPTRKFLYPKISISKSGYFVIAWISCDNAGGVDHKIEYRTFDKTCKPISQGIKSIPCPVNLSEFCVTSDDEAQMFTISFAAFYSDGRDDKVYLYKMDYSGNQKALVDVSTMNQHTKGQSTIILFNLTNYFTSWCAVDRSVKPVSNIFGRNSIFATHPKEALPPPLIAEEKKTSDNEADLKQNQLNPNKDSHAPVAHLQKL